MLKFLTVGLLFGLPHLLEAQSDSTSLLNKVFVVVDSSARYEGGMKNFLEVIGKTVKYPALAFRERISGTVYVEFIVEKSGLVDSVTVAVIKGIHPVLDEEALRVVKGAPQNWTPAYLNKRPVRQKLVVPISFRLPQQKPSRKM